MYHLPSSRVLTYWQLLHRIINFLIGLHILQNAVFSDNSDCLSIKHWSLTGLRLLHDSFRAMFAICIKLPSWNGRCANLLFVFIRSRYFSCGRLGNQRLSIRCLHLRCSSAPRSVCSEIRQEGLARKVAYRKRYLAGSLETVSGNRDDGNWPCVVTKRNPLSTGMVRPQMWISAQIRR